VADKLLAYSLAGQVRELRQRRRASGRADRHDKLTIDELTGKDSDFHGSASRDCRNDPGELTTLEEIERRYISPRAPCSADIVPGGQDSRSRSQDLYS